MTESSNFQAVILIPNRKPWFFLRATKWNIHDLNNYVLFLSLALLTNHSSFLNRIGNYQENIIIGIEQLKQIEYEFNVNPIKWLWD